MKLVILDSGHAKSTAGKKAPDNSFYEWDFNNKMQYEIKERLEDHKITVKLTNPNPATVKDIGLTTRANSANNFYKNAGKPKTIMLSIHANAYGSGFNSARGVEVFHASNASSNSKNLAKYLCDNIYTDVKKIDTNFKNRGVKCQDFTVIYKTTTPCALIEYGFYSNKEDLSILKNKRSVLVESTVKAVCKYFGIKYVAPSTKVESSTTTSSNSTYEVTATTLNVRKGRGTEHAIVGTVKKGQKIDIWSIAKDSKGVNWGSFRYSKTPDIIGYVHMDYLKKI